MLTPRKEVRSSVRFALFTLAVLFVLFATHEVLSAPSSVQILSERKVPIGSGVHIGDGLFITAEHVTADMEYAFISAEGEMPVRAEIVLTNFENDFSLLFAPSGSIDALAIDCGMMRTGDRVVAHGSLPVVGRVATSGTVIGESRVHDRWSSATPTDALIIPGMSGGAVTNDSGDMVGFIVGLMSNRIGFFVPSHAFCDLIDRR